MVLFNIGLSTSNLLALNDDFEYQNNTPQTQNQREMRETQAIKAPQRNEQNRLNQTPQSINTQSIERQTTTPPQGTNTQNPSNSLSR